MKRIQTLTLALLLALSLSGCFLLPEEQRAPELPLVTPYSGAEYTTAMVQRGDMANTAKVSFTYSPTRREELRFSVVNRKYGTIFVSVGDVVHTGDLLAQLDTSEEEAAIRDTAQQIRRLEIRLETARARLQTALEQEKLLGGGSTASSTARQADIRFYEASLELQQKKLEEQQAALEELRLYAPIDGTVTFVKALTEGCVSGRMDTVVTITDMSSSVFTAWTAEYALFPEGTEFPVQADEEIYLCVSRDPARFGLSASVDNGRRNVCLEILDEAAPAGSMRGTVSLTLDERTDVLYVTRSAVFTAGTRSYVYYEDASGLKSAREVSCGLDNGSVIEIVSGLEEGDIVIIG